MSPVALYIAEILAREEAWKPGITTDFGDRDVGYTKMGDIVNWHFVAVPLRPAFSHKIIIIEEEGKIFFKKDFRLGRDGIKRTEYIPKDKRDLLFLETYYREQISRYPGQIGIVRKEFFPMDKDSSHFNNLIENAMKYPSKYLEGFK